MTQSLTYYLSGGKIIARMMFYTERGNRLDSQCWSYSGDTPMRMYQGLPAPQRRLPIDPSDVPEPIRRDAEGKFRKLYVTQKDVARRKNIRRRAATLDTVELCR